MKLLLTALFILIVPNVGHALQSDWMSKIPDKTSLAAINIPGTHNSGATREPILGTAKCQSMSLQEQLESGTRFFDIRCRHSKDQFAIYHGLVSQNLNFTQVLKTFQTHLQNHPSETIVVSIKQEYKPRQNSQSFTQTLRNYIDQSRSTWYLEESIPSLANVRGKIVLLRRFASQEPLGIPAIDWESNGFHKAKNIFVQDRYSLPDADTKWKTIEHAFLFSTKEKSDLRIHLHYTSGYVNNNYGLPNIRSISDSINQQLTDYLRTASHNRHGFIIVDFMTPELAKSIYQLNFPTDN